MNGLKIDIKLEQVLHSEMLKMADTEEKRRMEHTRHEEALQGICGLYEGKLKEFQELGLLRE